MKRLLTLAFILLATTQFSFAQQAIAKIKYEEAEEAYAANNFELAVTKLNEAETLLKSTNPRIMYLKIMAQAGIVNITPNGHFDLMLNTKKLCYTYLKDYESLPDNEEKYREVYKKQEALNAYPNDKNGFEEYVHTKELEIVESNITKDKAFNLYTNSFNQGLASFRSKDWSTAYSYFSSAVRYSDIIFKNNWSSKISVIDTTSVLYAGYSAQNAAMKKEALKYYSKLIDINVKGGAYEDIYYYSLFFFTETNDYIKFYQVLNKTKIFYPNGKWIDYKMNFITENNTSDQKVALYDKENISGSLSEKEYLYYGDILAKLISKVTESTNSKQSEYINTKCIDAFQKAYNINPKNAFAAYNIGIIYNNQLDELVVHNEKKFLTNVELAVNWLEKAYQILKDSSHRNDKEQKILISAVDFLHKLNEYKGDKAKSNYYGSLHF